MRFLLVLFGFSLFVSPGLAQTDTQASAEAQCQPAEKIAYHVVGKFDRTQPGFTEGLVFDDGKLIESTGSYKSKSTINSIGVPSGQVSVLRETPQNAFGEGLAKLGSEYIQLTYKEKKIFTYDFKNLSLLRSVTNQFSREGWGLDAWGEDLVASDGTDRLHVLDPRTFSEKRSIAVRDERGQPVKNMNELEVLGDAVFANIYQTNYIYKIDLESGCVTGVMDMSPLLEMLPQAQRNKVKSDTNNVLNGIAYDPSKDIFYITGKNWPKIFEVKAQH